MNLQYRGSLFIGRWREYKNSMKYQIKSNLIVFKSDLIDYNRLKLILKSNPIITNLTIYSAADCISLLGLSSSYYMLCGSGGIYIQKLICSRF
jgi:hypothetical protein